MRKRGFEKYWLRPVARFLLEKKSIRASGTVGGAPVTEEVARVFEADGYAEGVGQVVQEAYRLISKG